MKIRFELPLRNLCVAIVQGREQVHGDLECEQIKVLPRLRTAEYYPEDGQTLRGALVELNTVRPPINIPREEGELLVQLHCRTHLSPESR